MFEIGWRKAKRDKRVGLLWVSVGIERKRVIGPRGSLWA